MKISILQKLLFFSFIILAGNGLIGFAVYQSNQKRMSSEQLVKHTEQVIYQTGNVLFLAEELESASRGFVITNDSVFLEPYKVTTTTLGYIEQLRQLTPDKPIQQQRVDSLDYYLHKYLDFSYKTVDIRSKQGLEPAIALVSTLRGKQYTDHIRRIINIIQYEENALLKFRKHANEQSVATFTRFSVIMFIFMTFFTILLLIVTGKNLIQNKEKEKRATELIIANEELAFQNREKEKRATELILAGKEIIIQHQEKEKQEAANKELEAFSYSVSHDLRAPLRHIGGFIDLLIKNNSTQLDPTGLRYLNIISVSSHEMGNLIDALLTFSRLSRTELLKIKIDSRQMVDRVLKTFDSEFAGRNIEIKISRLPDIMGDEGLINQVWVNLISNALKYSRKKEKALIEISGKTWNEKTTFTIRDNGAGFDMKYADKLFGVFQRLHKARDFEGIGIGLANVNRIITRHNGKCWAEAEVDKGATFSFSLPCK
jgi:signal transduction histidine kinase